MQVIRLAVIISAKTNVKGMVGVDYLVDVTPDHEETFVMDTLGNRTGNQTLTEGTVNFTVQSSTNRYTSIGGNTITHDDAGNMTTDKDDYEYFYDYENRLVKIEDSSSNDVAEYSYDALGRRIRMSDSKAPVTTLYYYNPDWQVLAEYNGSNELQRYYVYGNYIDEPLVMSDGTDDYYYVQDHLYSTVALIGYVDPAWVVVERCEYDAYGTATIFTDMTDWQDETPTTASKSALGNPYMFTGRRLDVLDDGNLLSQHSRNRTYDTYTARFLQHDLISETQLMNLYLYCLNNPTYWIDPYGLQATEYPGGDHVIGTLSIRDIIDAIRRILERIRRRDEDRDLGGGSGGRTVSEVCCGFPGWWVEPVITPKMLENSKVIAEGSSIDDVDRLVDQYGGEKKKWKKKKAKDACGRDVHWYEHHGLGRFEVKFK